LQGKTAKKPPPGEFALTLLGVLKDKGTIIMNGVLQFSQSSGISISLYQGNKGF
jgi:hypothetical protein